MRDNRMLQNRMTACLVTAALLFSSASHSIWAAETGIEEDVRFLVDDFCEELWLSEDEEFFEDTSLIDSEFVTEDPDQAIYGPDETTEELDWTEETDRSLSDSEFPDADFEVFSEDDFTGLTDTESVTEPIVESIDTDAEISTANVVPTTVMNLNNLPVYRGRTKGEVIARYSAAVGSGTSYADGVSETYYRSPSSVSPLIREGSISEDTLTKLTAMTNFYRWLVGVPALQTESTTTVNLQRAALVRNFYYSKQVYGRKPNGMSSSAWEAGQSYVPDLLTRNATPQEAIGHMMNCGYLAQSSSWYDMENRAVLTDPTLSNLRFGYSENVLTGTAYSHRNESISVVTAYPAPGYQPADVMDYMRCAWNLRIETDEIVIPDVSKLRVRVENPDSGGHYTCTVSNGKLVIKDGLGICFAQPWASSGTYSGRKYRISVTGLERKDGSEKLELTYTVTFFNVRNQVSTYVAQYSFDYTELVISPAMSEGTMLRKCGAVLPKTVKVITGAGSTYKIDLNGVWTLDTKNSCYRNSADASQLPSRVKDSRGILKDIRIPYRISSSIDCTLNGLSINDGTPPMVGSSAKVLVTRSDPVNLNRTRVYQVKYAGNQTYKGILRLDSSTSANFDSKSATKASHVFRIASVPTYYSGEYIALIYSTYFQMSAYVSSNSARMGE